MGWIGTLWSALVAVAGGNDRMKLHLVIWRLTAVSAVEVHS